MPFGLVLRIWDNVFVHGTLYLFQVSIAILKLIKEDLLIRDMDSINKLFSSFKDNEKAGSDSGHNAYFLPPDEDIIRESYKI
jgi:hypothetical protein